MTRVTMTIDDSKIRQQLKVLTVIAPKMLNADLNKAMEKAAEKVKDYPARLPEQKYKRTYTFFRSVKVTKAKRTSGGGYWVRTAALSTNARQKGRGYSMYVTGDSMGRNQARIHKGPDRWNVARNEVRKAMREMTKKTTQRIQTKAKV